MGVGADIWSWAALIGGIVLLTVGCLLGLLVLTSSMSGRNVEMRLRLLRHDYAGGGGAHGGLSDLAGTSLRGMMVSALEAAATSLGDFKLIGAKEQAQFRTLLLHCGIRRSDGLRLLVTIKVMSILGGTIVAVVGAIIAGVPTKWLFLVVVAGTLLGSLAPERILQARAKGRQSRIARRLPDALDLLIIFANAGYGLDQAIKQLSLEMQRSAPDLADEFAVTSDELRLLADRNQAMENLTERINLPAIRVLVSALLQAQKYGTPLTQALRVLAAEQRNAQIIDIEKRAARLPVLITMPLILLILPALFMIVATPAVIQVKSVWPSHVAATPVKGR